MQAKLNQLQSSPQHPNHNPPPHPSSQYLPSQPKLAFQSKYPKKNIFMRVTNNKTTRSRSSSSQYHQDRQYLQLKLVIPRKLAKDHNQLKYIQSLCHSEISIQNQKIDSKNQSIICIKGTLKNNTLCIKLLQKRILKLNMQSLIR